MHLNLTVRVAWHDDRWRGTVCRRPSGNPFCVALDRIRAERDEVSEDRIAGTSWARLGVEALPPCADESGAFMSPHEWSRVFTHPYQDNAKTQATHGSL